jgi:hypothetical protein
VTVGEDWGVRRLVWRWVEEICRCPETSHDGSRRLLGAALVLGMCDARLGAGWRFVVGS